MTTFSRSRFRSRGRVRIAAAMLLCAAVSLGLCAQAGAAPVESEADGFGALGRTALTAVASATNADSALGALTNGLAMIEARRKVDARAAAAPSAAPAPAATAASGPVD